VASEHAPTDANLVEIFSSVQGEGPHIGETTLFVRFGECDLRCRWCDTPYTWRPAKTCRFERTRGSAEFDVRDNPVLVEDAIAAAERLELSRHAFVSLTGGEPLLQPTAVREFALAIRARGPRVHLETHGLHADALTQVVDAVDVVSMDWKFASDVRRVGDPRSGPVAAFDDAHDAFLKIARQASEVVIKLVVAPATSDEEIDEVCRRVAPHADEISLILQPVTPFGGVREATDPSRLHAVLRRASAAVPRVRLIPQTNRILDLL